MELKTVISCPLGSKCEEIKDNTIHRCAWFQTFQGIHPTTGEKADEKGCSMVWLPILMIENSRQQLGTGAAIESFRNEMVKATESSQQVLMAAALRQSAPMTYIEE